MMSIKMKALLVDQTKDKGVDDELKKRKPDDADKDEGATDSDFAKHDDVEFDNTNMAMDRGEDLGKTNEQPNNENNLEGHRCPYDLTKPLPMQMLSQDHQIVPVDFFFNNDLEYLRGGSNDKKYTASTTRSKVARTVTQERVEDLQLGEESYQKKLNLTKPRT
nr:hypothetical protein [Tanacetum cinerariifolium]